MRLIGELLKIVVSTVTDQIVGVIRRATREEESKGLTRAESELQSKYAREAGKWGVVYGKKKERIDEDWNRLVDDDRD